MPDIAIRVLGNFCSFGGLLGAFRGVGGLLVAFGGFWEVFFRLDPDGRRRMQGFRV